MLIDWFTVGAQLLNFLILVWLLNRFLYRPILAAIDAREKRIAAELADAAAKKAEAQTERDAFQQKNDAFDKERATLLAKAVEDARTERSRLMDEARKAADALAAKRQEALRSDAQSLEQAIARRTGAEVFAIVRKTLGDLADTSLEAQMSLLFIRRLRALADPARADIAKALEASSTPVIVRSAFDLPAEQQAAVKRALDETFAADVQVRFETSPELVSGIELVTNGQKLAWSIADYLKSLEKSVSELLQARAAPGQAPS